MNRVVVVGASLAGMCTARALRAQGYDGELVVVGEEPHRPYDRPPLSKEFLTRDGTVADLSLEAPGEELDALWRLGTRAVALRPGPVLVLDTGETLTCDGLVLATGARARRHLRGQDLPGVHALRTLDDALALRHDLAARRADGGRVLVVGGGFIGSEVAATARGLGLEVVLVVGEDAPLRAALGGFADVVADLHRRHGVQLVTGARVREVRRVDEGLAVALHDGRELAAGTVVLGIGSEPAVDWLAGSGLELGDGVLCDHGGATSVPGVVAVGDCAAWFDPVLGRHHRVEHWTAARDRAAAAAATLLSGTGPAGAPRPPYLWSDLHGARLQLAGHPVLADSVAVEAGSTAEHSFVAVYRRAGDPVAVVGVDRPKEFNAVRRRLVPATASPQGALA